MTRSLAFLIYALFSFPSIAQIQIAQWIPWAFVEKNIVPEFFSVNRSDAFELNLNELRPLINFKTSLEGKSRPPVFLPDGIKVGQEISGDIYVEAITIDQWIIRNINGNIFRIYVKAACGPFNIQIRRMNSDIQFTYAQEGRIWIPKVQSLSFFVSDWEVKNLECNGIGGVAEEIKAQLKNLLSSPERFEPYLRNGLNLSLTEALQSSWESLLARDLQGLSLESMERPSAKGILIRGVLASKAQVLLKSLDENQLSESHPQFILSKEGFEQLLKDNLQGVVPDKFDLQSVSGFRNLMNSRLKQFFVWPDLMRFPKRNPFFFSALRDQGTLQLEKKRDGQYNAWFITNAVIRTQINDSLIDYLQLGLGLQAGLEVKVENGKLILRAENGKLQVASAYGLIYSLLYKPDRRIALDTLVSALNSMLKNQTFSKSLPVIYIDDREFRLTNFREENSLITMDWL